MREEYFFHRSRDIADMNDLRAFWAHDEWRFLDGVMTNRNNQVGPVNRLVDVVTFGKSRCSHVKIGSAVHCALAHLGIKKGNPHPPNEVGEHISEAWPTGRGAQHDQRKSGFENQRSYPIHRRRMRYRPTDRIGRAWT